MANRQLLRFALVMAALVVVLGAVFGGRYWQLKQQEAAAAQTPPPLPVEATTVAVQNWDQSISTVGGLRAVNGVLVTNEIAGIVEEIRFASGQQVTGGEAILQLNADTDRAALETLQAELKLAEQNFNRLADLIEDKAVSQADFDAAAASLEAAKARVHEQQARLDKKSIRAPFSGRAGLRQVDKGQFLEVGTGIVEIVMSDPIYVDFTVSERDLPKVAVGNQVEVRVAAFPDTLFSGAVEALNTSIRPESRTVQVRAKLDNRDGVLQPGMFAELRVFGGDQREVLTVPRTAIAYNTYGDYVFIIRDQNGTPTVHRRQVETGEVRDGRVAVVEGLFGDERIVATGLVRLRNGQPVRIEEPASSLVPGTEN